MKENNKNGNSFNILDIILVLLKYRLMIFLVTGITFVLILGISIISLIIPPDSPFNLLPNEFRSTAKILITLPGSDSDTGKFSTMIKAQEMSALLGVMNQGTQNTGKFIQELLQLNEIRDKIINKFNFIERYNIQQYPVTASRELFMGKMIFEVNLEQTVVTLGFEDIDSVFATDVLKMAIEEIVSKYNEISHKSLSRKIKFLEESVQVTEENYRKIQDKIISFKKEHGIIDISLQTKQSIEYLSKMKAQLVSNELELKKLLEYFSENDPKVLRKKKDIENAKQIITETEKGIGIYSDQFLPSDVIPELTREYLNLELELSIQASVYKMLREQYEAAHIEEMNISDPFLVIEDAAVPERKIRPSRVIICIIVTISAFFISLFIGFIKEYLKKAKDDSGEREKLAGIKSELSAFRLFKRKK
ncbi:MAG: hypothetical protein JXB88_02415 [Spirochaetales bacterium]|nr:hypothetical protein [Spirochaetales bacterium]